MLWASGSSRAFWRCRRDWIENRIDACVQRGICLQKLGRRAEAKQSCLASLAIAPPRAEALCALGELEMQEEAWQAAAFWYRAALLCGRPEEGGAFVCPDVYGYVPALQLCVCYDRLGRIRQASQMNERALLEKPGDRGRAGRTENTLKIGFPSQDGGE